MNPHEWRVLVVEDEFDSIQMMSKILRHHGIEVLIARTGFECLAVLERIEPTLVIMDLALPEMDGWETLEKIRANEKLKHLPVAAITAYHSVNVAEDAVKAGFNAYFPKPVDTAKIIQQLASLLP